MFAGRDRMSYNKYSLNIVSQAPLYRGSKIRKYALDGVETIGVVENEVFAIEFKNNSTKKVEVKLSLDGIDVLTGELANTDPSSKKWLVNPYSTLFLRAFPESTNGGAQFVFTNAKNSVAAGLHGNLSNQGIIAAAVFEDSYVEPTVSYRNECKGVRCRGIVGSSINEIDDRLDYSPLDEPRSLEKSLSLNKKAAVGAGEYVEQRITYAKGLVEPYLADTIKLNYLYWDQLKEKILASRPCEPNGFPGDGLINLKSIPKVKYSFSRVQDELSRF